MPRAKRTTPVFTRLLTIVFSRRAEEPVLYPVNIGRVGLGVTLELLPVIIEVYK